jgi:DNA-binding IclR family transcriptional regulator
MQKTSLRKKANTSPFKSVFRIAAILNCFNKGICTVSDIANTLKVNKSTIYRLLQTLNEAEITMRNPINRHYYIGPLIAQIAANPDITHNTLVLCAIDEMERLSELTGESIAINALIGINTYLLHEIPSTHDIRIAGRHRISSNLHAGGACKLLLSQLSSKDLRKVLDNISFVRLTERTVTDKEKLLEQLKTIRKQGYSVGYGERVLGAMSISAPIKNYVLPVSLGILGVEDRMKPKTAEYVNACMKSAAHIEYNLSRLFIDKEIPR